MKTMWHIWCNLCWYVLIITLGIAIIDTIIPGSAVFIIIGVPLIFGFAVLFQARQRTDY